MEEKRRTQEEMINGETPIEDIIDFLAVRLEEQEKITSTLMRASNYVIKQGSELMTEIDEMQTTLIFAIVLAGVGAAAGVAALALTIF